MQKIYVNPKGSTSAQQVSVSSLEEAKNLVRNMDKNSPIQVILSEGLHTLSETCYLTADDAGTEEAPITYRGEKGKNVILRGTKKITSGFESYENGILQLQLAKDDYQDNLFSTIFINGEERKVTRYPDDGYLLLDKADTWPHKDLFMKEEDFITGLETEKSSRLHIFPHSYWGNLMFGVKGFGQSDTSIHLASQKSQINEIYQQADGTKLGPKSKYMIENLYCTLTPGHFCIDEEQGVLYYYPLADEHILQENTVIEIPCITSLISIIGTKDAPVEHLHFKGLTFGVTSHTYLKPCEYVSMGDWGMVRTGSIYVEGAKNLSFTHNTFCGTGSNGLFFSGYNEGILIDRNDFHHIAESAICFVGESNLNTDKDYTCDFCGAQHNWGFDELSENLPRKCTVSNNHIHHIGVYGKQTAGVLIALASEILVSHNLIHHTPRSAITIHDGLIGGHIIQHNDIHHTVLETCDHGPFNSWGREYNWCHAQSHKNGSHPALANHFTEKKTSLIRHNRFRDERGWGIDLDDGSSDYHVYNNLCIGISIKLREGNRRLVENNIFINGVNPPSFHCGYEGNLDRFERNIIVMDSNFDDPEPDVNYQAEKANGALLSIINPPGKGSLVKSIDNNLYFNDVGDFKISMKDAHSQSVLTHSQWLDMGHDLHSLYADPCFVDFANGDYRLKAESQAFNLGFVPFDLTDFGPTREEK